MARIRALGQSCGGGALHVYSDIQGSDNHGQRINFGFAASQVFVCVIKNNSFNEYFYMDDGQGNTFEKYLSNTGGIADSYLAQLKANGFLLSADRTSFQFAGWGDTSGVNYNIYVWE